MSLLGMLPVFKKTNQALKVLYVALANEVGLLDPKLVWFSARKASVMENYKPSLQRNFKMVTHTTVEKRKRDLRVE